MFSFLVKRILSGSLVVILISMMVYALFWYGPKSPALEICRRDTNSRCTPTKLAQYEHNLGYDNPIIEEYGKWAKGLVAGRDIQFGNSVPIRCPAPCLGLSFRTRAPVMDELKTRFPVTFSLAIGAAALY